MNSKNFCQFEGRIAKEPVYSTINTANGVVEKAMFTLAVDRELTQAQRQAVKGGDKSIPTCDFISFSLVGSYVNTLRNYFPVGKAAHILAHFSTYTTTNQQTGQQEYKYIFNVDKMDFVVQDSQKISNNPNNNGYQQAPQQNYQQAPQNNYQQAPQQNYQQAPQQNYQQNGYQQAPQQNYQQRPQQAPQNNFAMFDDSDSPF